MNADYTGKQVSVTTTSGEKYKGILQNLDINNGTITMNNITGLSPPFMIYQPNYVLSFAGNDLVELNFIEEETSQAAAPTKAEEDDDEEESEEDSEDEDKDDDKDFMKQQEQFQKELEAMRNKSKKEKSAAEPKKSSFFDSFDDEEEYGKNRQSAAQARKTNYDTFGESGAYRNNRGRGNGNYRGRGGYRGRGNSRGRGGHQNNYYNRPSNDGGDNADILKTPMF